MRLASSRPWLFGLVTAGALHVGVACAVSIATRPDAHDVEADARAERISVLADAEQGRMKLGEAFIRLGFLDRVAVDPSLSLAERDHAIALYRAMLADVRNEMIRGTPLTEAVADAVAHDGRAARYKRMYPWLAEALVHGGGNCVALSTLAASLAHDAIDEDRGDRVGFRVFSNHVVPEVDGFHFGMASKCHGPGESVRTRDLLSAYRHAREAGGHEPFALPRAVDSCDDPGDVFGNLQLAKIDPPPPSPKLEAKAPEVECQRRTVLEEYQEDVEIIGADGRSLGGVSVPRAATLDLAGHAKSAACFQRKLDALGPSPEPVAQVLALADASMAAEDSARVFATGGELDVAREYEHRLSEYRKSAAAPLERVIAILEDPTSDPGPLLHGAGRLVSLGEGGRTAMLLASQRHRGYWELANLMTRSDSQAGAVKRWSQAPRDIQLDVVDLLPFTSVTFLAQVDATRIPAARDLRAACEARARADIDSCEALRAVEPTDDLVTAVEMRRLAVRCRHAER